MTALDADVLVVGLGIHGSAAAASLARRGVDVLAVERFAPAHTRGSSHGRTRMIRRAYPNPIWNESRRPRVRGLGRRSSAKRADAHPSHRRDVCPLGESQLQGPDCVVVDDRPRMAELMPRIRRARGVSRRLRPEGRRPRGVARARRAAAVRRSHGAELRWGVQAEGWERVAGGVVLRTDDGDPRARRLVIAGGAGWAALVPGLAPLLEVWRILTLTVSPGQAIGMPPSLGRILGRQARGIGLRHPGRRRQRRQARRRRRGDMGPEVPVAPPSDAEVESTARASGGLRARTRHAPCRTRGMPVHDDRGQEVRDRPASPTARGHRRVGVLGPRVQVRSCGRRGPRRPRHRRRAR